MFPLTVVGALLEKTYHNKLRDTIPLSVLIDALVLEDQFNESLFCVHQQKIDLLRYMTGNEFCVCRALGLR